MSESVKRNSKGYIHLKMFPFVHLPQYGLIVCSECQHAVLPSHVDTHLGDKEKHDMPKENRDVIIQEIQGIPGLQTERKELNRLVFPSPRATPIPVLQPPRE